MLLLILVILGTSIFCFANDLSGAGVVCLFGFSRAIGWLALGVTSILLLLSGHLIIAVFPVGIILWNVFGPAIMRRNSRDGY